MRHFLFILAAAFGPALCAQAQTTAGTSEPKPAMTLGQGSGPVKIEADNLEVRDKEKVAIFSGNVVAVRGDTTIRAGTMKAYYDAALGGTPAATGESAAPNQVRKIEMSGKVLFTQKDQQGTGDAAVYDRASDTLTLTGNVVLTQGQNVARGQKLIVEVHSGHARLEGRPNMILLPEDAQKASGRAKPAGQAGAKAH